MRKLLVCTCLLSTMGLLAIPVSSGQEEGFAIQSRPIVIYNCPIQPLREQRVPARVSGVLAQVDVREGDQVGRGQVLATIDDRLSRLELEGRTLEAENTSILGGAVARAKEAAAAVEDAEKLYKSRNLPEAQYRLEKAKLEVAEQGVVDAEVKFQLAGIEKKRAEAELERHKIVSEVDGVVILQVRQEGEAIQALDPIFHVIRTDKVKVEGSLHIRYKDRVSEGMVLDVYPNLSSDDRLNFQHTSAVNDVKVIPGDRLVATACQDGVIYVWDVRDVAQFADLSGHDGAVTCLATSPDAPQTLVSGGEDGMLRVWNLSERVERQAIRTQGGRIRAVAISPRNPSIAFTGHDDRGIRMWNLKDGKPIATLPAAHTNPVTSLTLTSDGKRLVSAGADQTVRLWDVDARKELQRFSGRSSDITQLGVSPSDDSFLFNSFGLLQIRSLPEGRPVAGFESRTGSFSGVAVFSPVQDLVLTANDRSELQLWQQGRKGRFPRLVRNYQGHLGAITGVSFSADGSFFATSSDDRSARIWLAPSAEQIEKERTRGVISFMNPQGEAGSESITIHAEVENGDSVLTPGSFATIVIYPDMKQDVAKLGAVDK